MPLASFIKRAATLPIRQLRRQVYTPRFRVDIHNEPLIRLGSRYGGWTLVDTPALTNSLVVSCGLGEDASFDVELCARYNARVIIVDPTPRAVSHFHSIVAALGSPASRPYAPGGCQPIAAYDLANIRSGQLTLIDKALWTTATTLKFFAPPNPEHVSHSITNFQNDYAQTAAYIEVASISLAQVIASLEGRAISLLKLDIEGAEIEVLIDMLTRKIFPEQILVEYDELLKPSRQSATRVRAAHAALVASGYRLLNIDSRSNFLYLKAAADSNSSVNAA